MRTKIAALSLTALVAAVGCNRQTTEAETDSAVETASNDEASGRTVIDADASQEFATKVAHSTMVEIETSKIAQSRAQRAEVRDFAAMMVRDHTKASQDLQNAAAAGLTLPTGLDQASSAKVQDIRNASIDNFDKDYLDLQEEQHEKAVDVFEDYTESGTDPELKAFATAMLPTIRQHLARVREIRTGLDAGDDMMGLGSGNDDTINESTATPTPGATGSTGATQPDAAESTTTPRTSLPAGSDRDSRIPTTPMPDEDVVPDEDPVATPEGTEKQPETTETPPRR